MHGEKRSFARLELNAKAFIHSDGHDIEGAVKNVSIKGVFMISASQVGINDVVGFSIDNSSTCDLKARVIRVTDKGIALEFEKTLHN